MKQLFLGTALSLATVLTALPAMAQQTHPGARDAGVAEQAHHGHHGRGHHGRHGRGDHGPERRLERMKADLQLSDAQVQRLRTVFEQSRQERQEFNRAQRERTQAQVESILTPAQKTRAEALRAERQEQRRQRHADCDHPHSLQNHQGPGHSPRTR